MQFRKCTYFGGLVIFKERMIKKTIIPTNKYSIKMQTRILIFHSNY